MFVKPNFYDLISAKTNLKIVKKKNLNIYSKTVSVGTRKINATVTREQIKDIYSMSMKMDEWKDWELLERELDRKLRKEERLKKIDKLNKLSDES